MNEITEKDLKAISAAMTELGAAVVLRLLAMLTKLGHSTGLSAILLDQDVQDALSAMVARHVKDVSIPYDEGKSLEQANAEAARRIDQLFADVIEMLPNPAISKALLAHAPAVAKA